MARLFVKNLAINYNENVPKNVPYYYYFLQILSNTKGKLYKSGHTATYQQPPITNLPCLCGVCNVVPLGELEPSYLTYQYLL